MKTIRLALVFLFTLAVPMTLPVRAETVVRFASLTSVSKAPALVVAEAKGFFQKHGVKVDGKLFAAGRVVNEALAAGQFDVAMLGDVPGLSLLGKGFPGKIVAVGMGGPARESVLVQNGSPYRSLADLKGKRVALTKGSTLEMILGAVLEKQGLTWADFQLINMNPPEKATALQLGQVDAVMAWEPTPAVIVTKGIGRRLVSGDGFVDDHPDVVIANDAILKKSPDAMIRFLRGLHEGAEYARSHPDEMVTLLSERLKVERAVLIDAIPAQWWYVEVFADTVPNWKRTAAFLHAQKRTKEALDVERFTDFSFLEKALDRRYPRKERAKDVMKYPVITVAK